MTKVNLRDRKKAETRARLAEAALMLFARDGIDNVTIAGIAEAAGVGKGTLYNYYACKEDILLEFLARVEASALPAIAAPRVKGRSLAQLLHAAAWSLLRAKAEHYHYARHVLARFVGGDAAFLARAESFQAAIHAAFAAMFAKLQDEDLVSRAWKVDELAVRFTVLHLGLSAFWAMEGPPFTNAERIVRGQTEIFARGIAP
jgi:AcrR family transcriptional regulator